MVTLDRHESERERALLASAEALLAEGAAFPALTVDEIARRAGIGRTAFYFYFRDKRQLLVRLTEDVAGALYEQADRWWHGEGDGAEELARIIGPVVRLWLRHAPALCAVVQMAGWDDEVRDFWRALADRFIDATRDRIEREQAAGRAVAGVPPAETSFALVWMTERACYEHAQRKEPAPEALIEALTGIWLRSVYGRLEESRRA